MNFAISLHTVMVIGKYTDVFRGDYFSGGGGGRGQGGEVTREDLSMEEFIMGEENFLEAGFSSII